MCPFAGTVDALRRQARVVEFLRRRVLKKMSCMRRWGLGLDSARPGISREDAPLSMPELGSAVRLLGRIFLPRGRPGNGTAAVLHPPTCLCFCVLLASALPPTCSCFVFCTQELGNMYKPCSLQVPTGDIYKPFSLMLSASWAMGLSGLAVTPAPVPCAMHDTRRPRSRSRWVLGLRLVAVATAVSCVLFN
jgi:hypothetical protein